MSLMIRIRLAGTGRYIGKKNLSYAFASGEQCAVTRRDQSSSDFWLVPEKKARVWTETASLLRVLTMAAVPGCKWHENTWSRYEVVLPDDSAIPLDDWLTQQGLRPAPVTDPTSGTTT